MFKKLLIMVLGLSFLGIGLILAQQIPVKPKPEDLLKRGYPGITIPKDKLYISLWVECCWDQGKPKSCEDILEEKGFMLVNYISVDAYNGGDKPSQPISGKVEFFDYFTNSKKTFNFNVASAQPKQVATVTPSQYTGPFLVKRQDGILLVAGTLPITLKKYTECSMVY